MYARVSGNEVQEIIKSPKTLTVNGVTHPRNIFTSWGADELQAIGILPYREETVNNRYYWSGNVTYTITPTEVVGSYAEIDRDIDQLKEGMLAQVKATASSLLTPSDWMVIRAADGGTAVDSATSDYRAAVRTTSNTKEVEINAITTLAGIIAYENHPVVETRKVKHTAEDGTETYGPETEDFDRNVSKVNSYEWPIDPAAEIDPAFVSIADK